MGKVAGAVVPYVAKRLPGVGNALQALGVEQAREIPGKLALPDKAEDLYRVIARRNPKVPLTHTGQVANRMLTEELALP